MRGILPGVGLMEIVTMPDISSGEQAAAFVHDLLLILRTIGTCDGRLEGKRERDGWMDEWIVRQ